MSTRSDVGIAMTKDTRDGMKQNYPELMTELISYSDSDHKSEEQVLIVLNHVKWETDIANYFAHRFMNALRTFKSDTYHVVEVCGEYNQVNAEGNLEDQFDLHGVSITELQYNAC